MPVFKNKDMNSKLGEINLAQGCGLPIHTHTVEDCMYIVEGKGEMYINEEIYPIEAGDQILVPAGTKHNIKNTGKNPLVLVFTYPSVNNKEAALCNQAALK
jgi:mannose-6-phosphate isomerase-like protein (cupin superfamily)